MSLESALVGGRCLRLIFDWQEDRYTHQIELVRVPAVKAEPAGRGEPAGATAAEQIELVAASVEGTGMEEWPPSPPLQQLHLEDRGRHGRVALLVGMSGRHHWSLSVEAGPAGGLLFDAACRVGSERGEWTRSPGSSYQLASRDVVGELTTTAYLDGWAGWSLTSLPVGGLLPARLACDKGLLAVVPHEPPRSTLRWIYLLNLSEPE